MSFTFPDPASLLFWAALWQIVIADLILSGAALSPRRGKAWLPQDFAPSS